MKLKNIQYKLLIVYMVVFSYQLQADVSDIAFWGDDTTITATEQKINAAASELEVKPDYLTVLDIGELLGLVQSIKNYRIWTNQKDVYTDLLLATINQVLALEPELKSGFYSGPEFEAKEW